MARVESTLEEQIAKTKVQQLDYASEQLRRVYSLLEQNKGDPYELPFKGNSGQFGIDSKTPVELIIVNPRLAFGIGVIIKTLKEELQSIPEGNA